MRFFSSNQCLTQKLCKSSLIFIYKQNSEGYLDDMVKFNEKPTNSEVLNMVKIQDEPSSDA